MKDFRTLSVREKSHQITLTVYKHTHSFPKEEVYGLTSQIRRASSSIAINIAEGSGRGSEADFARFLQISLGSASETEYLILLSYELNYLSKIDYEILLPMIQQIKKMLTSLILKIKNSH